MFVILLFTVIGFLAGLFYVMKKRKIHAGRMLSATLLGLSSLALWKIFKKYFRHKGRFF